MLDEALKYAARGLPVLPLVGKQPAIPKAEGGRGYLDATCDVAQITAWWTRWPTANIGVRTGKTTNSVVVDIDPRNGGVVAFEDLLATYGALPDSWTVLTGGGGTHHWFAHPGELAHVPSSSSKIGPGIDVKSDPGYVVMPPSIHPDSGKAYEWELSSEPDDIPLAPLPLWLRAKCVESPAEKMAPKPLPKIIEDGERNEKLTSLAGTLRGRDMDFDEIVEVLDIHNRKRCRTPVGDDEVRAIAQSVMRYKPRVSARQPDAVAGGDASALVRRDAPVADAEARRGAELKGPALHATMEEDIPRWLQKRGVSVNAIGDWVHTANGRIAGVHVRLLASEYANHFRRCRQFVTVTYVQEILEEHERARMKEARTVLAAKVLGLRGGDDSALIDWLIAVTGEADELHIAVMKHWLWQVKRALAHLPIDHQLMPILVGPQGSGKSTAAARLCGPLKELACIPASGDMLADKRQAPMLGRYVIGLWDEMEGADRASVEAVKRTITSARAVYRPMATNASATVDVTMQWIGTSNKVVAAMFRDATGNRRFAEITTLPRCDWKAVDAIDYDALWSCVDHEQSAPITPHLSALAQVQGGSVHRDSVAAWLAEEDWSEWQDKEGVRYSPRTTFDWIPAREMRHRYFTYCDRERARSLDAEGLGSRLKELGWERSHPRINGTRIWAYVPPVEYRMKAAIA